MGKQPCAASNLGLHCGATPWVRSHHRGRHCHRRTGSSHGYPCLRQVQLAQVSQGPREVERGAYAAGAGHWAAHEMAEETLAGSAPAVLAGVSIWTVPASRSEETGIGRAGSFSNLSIIKERRFGCRGNEVTRTKKTPINTNNKIKHLTPTPPHLTTWRQQHKRAFLFSHSLFFLVKKYIYIFFCKN